MVVAVTAASGRLGTQIVAALGHATGVENIVAVARTPAKVEDVDVEVRKGDYNNREELIKAFEGVDAVLLVSSMDHPENRPGQHRNVIQAAKSAGVGKLVYTSIQGAEEGTAFSPIVQSNRRTERDIQESGLQWVIGRNGIYIEPDIEYLDTYKKMGAIVNCAGDGRCGYTTRSELASAFVQMIIGEHHNGQIYNLHGEALTQTQLAEHLNSTFDTDLIYREVSVEEFRQQSIEELGEFLGTIVGGIYEGIRAGKSDNPSHFEAAAGRPHLRWSDYFAGLRS